MKLRHIKPKIGIPRIKQIAPFAAVTALGGIGLLLWVKAASISVTLEAESANRTGQSHVVTDATASGGSALHFGAPTTPLPSPTPTPAPGVLSAADLTRIAGLKIFFGHQSVGGNILQGIPEIYSAMGATGINQTGDSTSGTGGFFADSLVGENGDPAGKDDSFAAKIRSGIGSQVQVALYKYCYVDMVEGSNPQTMFDHYKANLARLESAYPNVKFLYATIPLTTNEPSVNALREQYNRLIRQQYGKHGQVI